MRKRCVLFLFLLLAALPLRAAEPALTEILTGKAAPLSVPAKTLTPAWMCLTIAEKNGGSPLGMLGMMAHMGGPGNEQAAVAAPTFYTQGKIVSAGTESFLITYQLPPPAEQKMRFPWQEDDGSGPEPTLEMFLGNRLPADAVLTLSLLNLREVSAITGIRPFDPANELVNPDDVRAAEKKLAAAKERALYTKSSNNLRQLVLAVSIYAQDHDEVLPEAATWADDLAIDKETLINPISKEPYAYNKAIGGVALGKIKDPTTTVVVYEATPAADGTRGVAFCDGHVERVNADRWQQLMPAKVP